MACLFALASLQPPPALDAWRNFRPFTATHAFVLIACAACTYMIVRTGLRWRGTPRQRSFEQNLAVTGLVIWTLANAYVLLPGIFEWTWALPLQVCDLCALIAPIVIVQANPPAWQRSTLYFWGVGLCTQAFLTPTLRDGPADPMFWGFWGAHFVILIFALYDLIVRRWRPGWRDWRSAIVLSAIYLAVILPIDIAFGWNYGFIGREEKAGTLIEVLGPWPARVGVLFALAVAAYTLLLLPWVPAHRRRN